MPQRYSRQSSQLLRSQSTETLQPTDVDDSIVLSDLVRSGEASRLRRRGAIRLDHNGLNAQQTGGGRRTPPAVVIVRSPTWVPVESPTDDESQDWDQSYEPSRTPSRRPATEHDAYAYTLFCGGEESPADLTGPVQPFEPSPLPSYPPYCPEHRSHKSLTTPRLNGCGAVIHTRASSRQNVWVAKGEATCAVVPMDACYFQRTTVAKMMRSPCGCIREGVGCAICGNTLGTRYKPCQAAAEGLLTPPGRFSGPLRPEGPHYWHSQKPATSNSQSKISIYTFFGSNVTSTISAGSAKDRPNSPTPQQQTSTIDDSFNSYTFFDRVITASPGPMSGEDDGVDLLIPAPVIPQSQPELDPDGAYIAEPDSPDKTGNELILILDR